MRIGAIFPQAEIAADVAGVRSWAQAVEEAGFDYILAYDHVAGAAPRDDDPRFDRWPQGAYDHESLFHEPMVLFGYLAAITRRVELATGVVILPQRQTVLAAKQLAEVDVLSEGRLRVGVGIGWNHLEYEALGQDFTTRGKRLEEQIALLRRLWTEPVVDFVGRWDRVPRMGIKPLPLQRPIPVWIGGRAEAALRRAARVADGWTGSSTIHDPTLEHILRTLRGALDAEGRDPSEFGIEGWISIGTGTPDDWRRELERWRALGATHVAARTLRTGVDPERHAELQVRFKEAVDRG